MINWHDLRSLCNRYIGRVVLFVLFHFVLSTLVCIGLAWLTGRLTAWLSIIGLFAGTVGAWWVSGVFNNDAMPKIEKPKLYESAVYLVVLIAGLRHFGYMFFPFQQWYRTLARYNVGDLPLHIAYIRNMSAGGDFPPADPIWAFDKLRYPFGMDLYNAMWDTLGLHLQTHLFFTGFILLVLSIVLLRWWGGVLLVGSFFLGAAWVGWECLFTGDVEKYLHDVLIKNFFLQHFITQRGFLVSIPLGVFVFKSAYDHIRNQRVFTKKQLLFLGLMWGSIACFHLHSFVTVSIMMATTFVLYGKWQLRKVAPLFVLAMPIGIVTLGYMTNWLAGSGDKSLFEIDLGWYATKPKWGGPNLVHFWWFNLGLWLLFLVTVAVAEWAAWWKKLFSKNEAASRSDGAKYAAEWLFLLGWFVFFNIVMIGSWDRDNNLKFMLWLYLGMMALASARMNWLAQWMREKIVPVKAKPWLATSALAVLYSVLFFSGAVGVVYTITPRNQGFFVYDREELEKVKNAMQGVSPNAVIAAKDTFNHPLTYWGHRLVMGYGGHVWSHGYNFLDVQNKLSYLYKPRSDWKRIVSELNIDYIFVGPWERHAFGYHRNAWQDELENISKESRYEVYRVPSRDPPSE